ncbi:MAG: glycerol-3-phosphate acyltransferase, partial [Paracoccaceae bacterium]|nr:glycerol-3-phosphate acyltransferase [Paracoccaceae bacterium]
VCLTWLVAAAVGRISSVAALIAAASSGLWILFFSEGSLLLLSFVLTVLIYVRHIENLKRIKAGTEPRIGRKTTPTGG